MSAAFFPRAALSLLIISTWVANGSRLNAPAAPLQPTLQASSGAEDQQSMVPMVNNIAEKVDEIDDGVNEIYTKITKKRILNRIGHVKAKLGEINNQMTGDTDPEETGGKPEIESEWLGSPANASEPAPANASAPASAPASEEDGEEDEGPEDEKGEGDPESEEDEHTEDDIESAEDEQGEGEPESEEDEHTEDDTESAEGEQGEGNPEWNGEHGKEPTAKELDVLNKYKPWLEGVPSVDPFVEGEGEESEAGEAGAETEAPSAEKEAEEAEAEAEGGEASTVDKNGEYTGDHG